MKPTNKSKLLFKRLNELADEEQYNEHIHTYYHCVETIKDFKLSDADINK